MSELAAWIPAELQGLVATRELTLGRAVVGQRQGSHRSRRAGPGRDFLEHRAYQPGDDLRQLDWRAVGRRDRLVVRRTEAEDEFGLALLLDTNGGMRFPGGLEPAQLRGDADHDIADLSQTKFDVARSIAATLAQMARRRRDPVGFLFAGESREISSHTLAPRTRREQTLAFAAALRDARPEGRVAWEHVLEAAAAELRRPCLVVAFSDVLDAAVPASTEADASAPMRLPLLEGLASLRARGHAVVLVHTLHHAELVFPWADDTVRRFVDLRGASPSVDGTGATMRERYLQRFESHLAAIQARCERDGLGYVRAVAGRPLAPAVATLLDTIAIREPGRAGPSSTGSKPGREVERA